jgi:hypothetical protein
MEDALVLMFTGPEWCAGACAMMRKKLVGISRYAAGVGSSVTSFAWSCHASCRFACSVVVVLAISWADDEVVRPCLATLKVLSSSSSDLPSFSGHMVIDAYAMMYM